VSEAARERETDKEREREREQERERDREREIESEGQRGRESVHPRIRLDHRPAGSCTFVRAIAVIVGRVSSSSFEVFWNL